MYESSPAPLQRTLKKGKSALQTETNLTSLPRWGRCRRTATDEGLQAAGTAQCAVLLTSIPHQALSAEDVFRFRSRNRRCSADEEKLREALCASYSSPPRGKPKDTASTETAHRMPKPFFQKFFEGFKGDFFTKKSPLSFLFNSSYSTFTSAHAAAASSISRRSENGSLPPRTS